MPKSQLHRRSSTDQVKLLLDWYLHGTLTLRDVCDRLQLGRSRFYDLLRQYQVDPAAFALVPPRRSNPRQLPEGADRAIAKALRDDRRLIEDPTTPVTQHNYAALRDRLEERGGITVSAETVRRRAHQWGFVTPRPPRTAHDRVVLTSAVGQLLQHDASHHRWSPLVPDQWTLITTLDDYSRLLLYAELVPDETAWAHLVAARDVLTTVGIGLRYYTDNHAIFRFVAERDTVWRTRRVKTDEVHPHWKRALRLCGMDVTYALSPQAKGKIERPYRWLQDRVVRRCGWEGVTTLAGAQEVLRAEVEQYNHHRVHSTTKEVPSRRFERAVREGKTVFRPFALPPPYTSLKDIFCLVDERTVNGYRRIRWRRETYQLPRTVPVGATVELHIIPDAAHPELRVWYNDQVVVGVQLLPGAA